MFQIIPPRFTLPMRANVPPVIVLQQPVQQVVPYECHTVAEYLERETPVYVNPPVMPRHRRRSRIEYTVLVSRQVTYFLIAVGLALCALLYFDSVWKSVSLVITSILWNNLASSAARHKSAKEQAIELIDTMSTQAVRIITWSKRQQEELPVLGSDTAFLVALKKRWMEDAAR